MQFWRRCACALLAAGVVIVPVTGAPRAATAAIPAPYYLWTGQSNANTQLDATHLSSWYINVLSSTVDFGGGDFKIKKGPSTSAPVVLTLHQGGPGGTALATITVAAASFSSSSYEFVAFHFPTSYVLTPGRYYVSLTSTAPTQNAHSYSIKGAVDAFISLDGTLANKLPDSIATTTQAPEIGNFTVSKTATASVATGGAITYTIGLGNDGGQASGTTTTVKDQLPTGVTATAATAGRGVSAVTCTNLNTASGLLTCTVTLASALQPGSATGTAAFTITATAPSTGGSVTNYASVSTDGVAVAATPSASCLTASCASAGTTVTAPATFTVSKSATASVVTSGSITYEIGLGNSGGSITGTTTSVKDQLPAGVTATAVTAGTGVSSVTCTNLNTASALLTCSVTLSSGISAGAANGTAGFTITASAPASAGSVTNFASVSANGAAAAPSPGASCVSSACASAATTVLTPVNFTLSKSATGTVITSGSITYTLGLGNSGGSTSGTSVTVADQLPAGASATAATAGTGVSAVSCTNLNTAGALLSCSVTLSSGLAASSSNGAALFTVTVTAPASAGGITNYASVDPTGGGSPASPGASCATTSCANASTTVNTPANFTLSKSATGTVLTGGSISYTLGIGNSGGTTSGTSVTVADQLPAGAIATAATAGTGVSSVSCTNLNTASARLTCSVTLSAGLAASAANGAAAFSLTVTAPSSGGSITNYASVDPAGGSSPATPGASCGTASCANAATTVNAAANFTLAKSATGTVVTGGAITYTLGLGNSGGITSGTSVTIADQLPSGATATAASAGTGVSSVSCTNLNTPAALLICTVTLSSGITAGAANGAAAFALTVTAPSTGGSITNYASVDPSGGGSPATPGASCATASCANAATTVNAASNFTLSKSATGTVVTGGAVTYTLGLGNSGGTASGTSVTVADQLPAGATATAATAGTGVSSVSCTNLNTASARLTCTVTLSSALAASAANGTAAFTVTVTAPASAGSITNYASVDPSGGSSPATPGASCATSSCANAVTSVNAASNFTLSKSATATVLTGGSITYTLGIGNSGGTTSGTSVTVADQLPAGAIATAATAGTGVSSVSCTNLNTASARLTCSVTLSAGLTASAANGAAAFSLTVTAPSSGGSITNYASVDPAGGSSPATPGASCGTASCANAATTVNTAANFTLAKSATGTVLPSAAITYTLGIGNSGGSTSGTSVTVADQLPSGAIATAATAGTGVSSVSCTNLNTAGALLTCSVTLSGGLAANAANGTAAFALTVTAPSSTGSITNYASVDASGGASPAAPGASCGTTSCASAATTVITASNITLSKSATSAAVTGASITYTLGLGNSGGSTSGTSITVADQLPSGATATAATAGTGVSSVSCTNLNTASALLTCTVTLSSGLGANTSNGTAAFTLTATAPSSAGSITNYASVDPAGGGSPATPGASCSTGSCASAATTVATPSRFTLAKTATSTVLVNGAITYTLGLGNGGGSASGTSATVADQLPSGVLATGAIAGTGVSSVSCTNLNTAGALVTCTVSLSSVLAAGAANGSAAFTLTATAPASSGSLTNYASVDSGGGGSPAAPGAGCSTESCASITTTVNTGPQFTLGHTATAAVVPGGAITYTLLLGNDGGSTTGTAATIAHQLPAGVTAISVTAGTGISAISCTNLNAAGALLTCSATLTAGFSAGAANGAGAFTILATAPASAGTVTSYAAVDPAGGASPSTPGASCATTSCASAATNVASASGYTLSQTATSAVAPSGTITYTISIGNGGGSASGTSATIDDQLPAGVTALSAAAGTGVTSVSCSNLNVPAALLRCTLTLATGIPAGAANGAAVITLQATAPSSGGSIINYASIDASGAASPASPGATCNTASCASATTTVAAASGFTLSKTAAATAGVNGTLIYTLGLGNGGGSATGTSVTVADQLPAGVRAVSAGPGAGVSSVSCSNLNVTGALLRCAVTLSAPLAAGSASGTASFTVTTTAPATAGDVTNYASVDPAGGGNPPAPGASCSTANCANASTTVVTGANFTLSKTAPASVGASGAITYSFGVGNNGGSASGSSVTIADQLPSGFRATAAAAGPGVAAVSCTNLNVAGGLVRCTLTLEAPLPPGAAIGTAAFTLATAAGPSAGAVTNHASVDPSGGSNPPAPGPSCSGPNCASAASTVLGASDLVLALTHPANVRQGDAGVPITAAVSNIGGQPTSGTVTVSAVLPVALQPVQAGGSGWVCGVSGQAVTCSRADALAAGAAYPQVSIGVNVAVTAPVTATTTGTVSGGGQVNTLNDAAVDVMPIAPNLVPALEADLRVTSNAFLIGLQSGVTIDVRNGGTGPSAGLVTVTSTLTGSVSLVSATGSGWTCSIQGLTVTCTRSDSLPAGASYPTLTILVEVTTAQPETGGVSVTVSGGGMTSPRAQSITVPISFAIADLTPHITHTGVLARLQPEALFDIDVQNLGPHASTGVVRLNLTVPAGLRVLSIAGDGWACGVEGQIIDCTRSDNLRLDQKYPMILRVAVSGDAADNIALSGQVFSDHDPVPANNTAADQIRVITFLGADFKVDKTVDRPMLRIGEAAQFSLVIRNRSEAQLDDVTLTDSLARGFSFVNGTARITRTNNGLASGGGGGGQTGATAPQIPVTIAGTAITPSATGDGLAFHIGRMPGLAEVTITYYTIVGLDAKPGTQLTRVVGTFRSPLGDVVAAAPVEVAVSVAPTQFSSAQVLVGRVFDDVDGNGRFERGDAGLAGVRVLLPTGQAAVTDKDGLYNLPAIAPGSTTVTVDADTVPTGYGLPDTRDPREKGWTRLVRSPLGAGAILRQNFALVKRASGPPGVAAEELSATPSILLREATGHEASERMARHVPDIARLEIQAARGVLASGGRDRTLVTVRAFDAAGAPVKAGTVSLETTAGQWLLTPASDAHALPVAGSRVAGPAEYCAPHAPGVELPPGLRTGAVFIRDGSGVACLQSDVLPATAELTVGTGDRSGALARTSVRFSAMRQAPVFAAIGELAIGRGEVATTEAEATGNVHGFAALFFQGSIGRGAQLTFAATSADSINQAAGVDRRFGNDPEDRTYPVFGDSSTRQELALSASRVFARVDVGRSSLLYGDLRGDQSRLTGSGLLDVARSLTGTQVHLERTAGQWLTLQAARPDTAFARDLFPGTAAGVLRLSHASMLPGSETLTLEVRDRRRPDLVVDRTPLVRGVDYVADPIAGVIHLNRQLPLFDQSLSIAQIVATYDYATSGLENSVFVARAQQSFAGVGLSIRAMAFTERTAGSGNVVLGGLEFDQRLPNRGRLHVELPVSHGVAPAGVTPDGTALAVRAELDQPLAAGRASVRVRFARTGETFANPYGSPVVPGSTIASGAFEFKPASATRVSLTAAGEAAHSLVADATRSTLGAEISQKIGSQVEVTAGIDARRLKDDRAGREIDSQLVTAAATWRPGTRFEASARREQNLGDADPTYPDQTVLNARYRLGSGSRIFATQRWSEAPIIPMGGIGAGGLFSPLSTRETAIGIESKLHTLTSINARYQIDGGLSGADSFAVLGVLTRIPVTRRWSLDGGLDRAVRVHGDAPGYTSATGGIAFTPEHWRATLHAQYRDGEQRTALVSAGLAGQLTPAITAMAHYRTAGFVLGGEERRRIDALAAIAIRPKQSDRVGVLFAWNYGDELSPMAALTGEPGNRIGRLSADGYYQVTSRLETFQRLALLRTDLGVLGSASTYLWQGRGQYKLGSRFDVAGEMRWLDELGTSAEGRWIGAGEVAYWVGPDLRMGVGYTTRPWSAVGPTLETTAGRGGVYLVVTSRLSSLFDLFTARKAAAGTR